MDDADEEVEEEGDEDFVEERNRLNEVFPRPITTLKRGTNFESIQRKRGRRERERRGGREWKGEAYHHHPELI